MNFRERLRAGLQKIVKIWPNEPPPFERNQEELSVYKVLLLWELIADKLFLIMGPRTRDNRLLYSESEERGADSCVGT